ncbi:unnamed protein product [Cyprideis torosa]|uniref:Fringe-like glycosyltransferase domain-containing protein n=1 Tax=Cyprideis torosa TaxID=163714 RepID=A0A7R8ZRT3_9CRUS|nr:unnamed protein product [Cyprideis torosa]CAG0899831.1 unnamed protein product [Cyprideis torosa]
MAPYRRTVPGSSEERFNLAHARTRSVIERSFGRLKRRFYASGNLIRMTPERCSMTFFFTDGEDPLYESKTGFHLLNTNCSSSHSLPDLNCKTGVEFDTYLESNKKWWCKFDDDTYVNVPRLLALLKGYDAKYDWYLGKPSYTTPYKIMNPGLPKKKIFFWFATGAAFCLSRATATRLTPLARVDPYGLFRPPVEDAELQERTLTVRFKSAMTCGDDVARQSPLHM